MAITIDSAYISQFSDNMHILLRQRGSKVRSLIPVEQAVGEKHLFNRLDKFTASPISDRLASPVLQDAPHSRRMATVTRYGAPTTLDDVDKLQMLIDPTSEYAKGLADAHGTNFDAVYFNAALGSASTGKDGTGSQTFDTTNQQIAHGSAGLTLAKINQAIRIMQVNEVDIERDDLMLFVGGRGIEDLFGESQFTNFDYRSSKPYETGVMGRIRGIPVIHTEQIPDSTSGSVFRALLMTKNAVKVAMAQDLSVKIDEVPLMNHALLISTYMMFGAVRMEEKLIVDILYQ